VITDNNFGIIIQARMGSSRLPGKILKPLGDKTLLEHILFRLSFLKHNARIIIATSLLEKDNIVECFCRNNDVNCFRGSEDNVLERYYLCAKYYIFKHIVRLTADNPFYDIEELDNLIDLHLSSGADYSHSFSSLPVGVGAEIFTFDALQKSYNLGRKPNHFEHVNEYITDNPDSFKIEILSVPAAKNRHDIRLTIDTQEDYDTISHIIQNLKNGYSSLEEIINIYTTYAGRERS
jgi:spore coat polysaccharide biosynthesis protein SpsF